MPPQAAMISTPTSKSFENAAIKYYRFVDCLNRKKKLDCVAVRGPAVISKVLPSHVRHAAIIASPLPALQRSALACRCPNTYSPLSFPMRPSQLLPYRYPPSLPPVRATSLRLRSDMTATQQPTDSAILQPSLA